MRKLLGRTHRKRRKRKLETSLHSETYLEGDQNYNLICKWMGENGYKSSKKLKPRFFNESGRGLMTEEVIHSGDIILAIPQNILITTEVVLKSEIGRFIKKHCPKASGHQILSVFLMFEKTKGELSEWHPYIKTLPESYNIPAFFGHNCLSVMPSFIYRQALKQVTTVEDSYNDLNVLLRHLERSFSFPYDNLNLELFKWAWCTVNTRCVFIDCFKKDCIGKSCKFHLALAPFLDLLNHSIKVQVRAGFNRSSKQYEIISLSDFKKYSQVFINYGSHDSCALFLEYGFVVPDNINDTISFFIDDIISAYEQCQFSSPFLCSKLQFISQNNLIQNSICSHDGLSWNLNIILRILTTDHDIKWWKSRLSNHLQYVTDDGDKFRKLRKNLLFSQLSKYTNNSLSNENSCEYSSLQLQISQLLSIYSSILIKTIE